MAGPMSRADLHSCLPKRIASIKINRKAKCGFCLKVLAWLRKWNSRGTISIKEKPCFCNIYLK